MISISDMVGGWRKQDYFCRCNTSEVQLHCPVYGVRYDREHVFFPFNEHSDVCDTRPLMIYHWTQSKMVFKQHLPPSRHHLRAIIESCSRVVVLLRDAWHATQSYCQRILSELNGWGVFRSKSQMKAALWAELRNASSDQSLARQYQAHVTFAEGWRAMQRLWPQLILIITYDEMQAHPGGRAAAFEKAIRWWGATPNKTFVDRQLLLVNRSGGECARMMKSLVQPSLDSAAAAATTTATTAATARDETAPREAPREAAAGARAKREAVGRLPARLPASMRAELAHGDLDAFAAYRSKEVTHLCVGTPIRASGHIRRVGGSSDRRRGGVDLEKEKRRA